MLMFSRFFPKPANLPFQINRKRALLQNFISWGLQKTVSCEAEQSHSTGRSKWRISSDFLRNQLIHKNHKDKRNGETTPPKKIQTTNMQEANTNWDDLWQNELHIFSKKHKTNDEHTKNAFASGRRQLFRESLSEMKGSLDSFTNTFLLDLHDLWLQLSIFIWHTSKPIVSFFLKPCLSEKLVKKWWSHERWPCCPIPMCQQSEVQSPCDLKLCQPTWCMNLIKKTFTSFWIIFFSWYFYESGACQALLFQRQQSARNVLRTNSSCFIEAPQIGRQEIRDNSPFRFTDLCPTQIRTASNKSHESPCKKKVDDRGWSGSIWRIFSLWIFDVTYSFLKEWPQWFSWSWVSMKAFIYP